MIERAIFPLEDHMDLQDLGILKLLQRQNEDELYGVRFHLKRSRVTPHRVLCPRFVVNTEVPQKVVPQDSSLGGGDVSNINHGLIYRDVVVVSFSF